MKPVAATAAVFSILMGCALLGTWAVIFVLGPVPDLASTPFETIFLLGAEALTGLSSIIAGYGLLSRRAWGLDAEFAALGMMLYCTVNYCGVLLQEGSLPGAAFIAGVALASLVLILSLIRAGAGIRRRPEPAAITDKEGRLA